MAFREVFERLIAGGWKLTRIWPPYRVFTKEGHLPILVRVENKQVDDKDAAKIFEILKKEDQQDEA